MKRLIAIALLPVLLVLGQLDGALHIHDSPFEELHCETCGSAQAGALPSPAPPQLPAATASLSLPLPAAAPIIFPLYLKRSRAPPVRV